ncbi:hypothetical protein AAMO2058_000670200 [Amorphochlora amoebiformis]
MSARYAELKDDVFDLPPPTGGKRSVRGVPISRDPLRDERFREKIGKEVEINIKEHMLGLEMKVKPSTNIERKGKPSTSIELQETAKHNPTSLRLTGKKYHRILEDSNYRRLCRQEVSGSLQDSEVSASKSKWKKRTIFLTLVLVVVVLSLGLGLGLGLKKFNNSKQSPEEKAEKEIQIISERFLTLLGSNRRGEIDDNALGTGNQLQLIGSQIGGGGTWYVENVTEVFQWNETNYFSSLGDYFPPYENLPNIPQTKPISWLEPKMKVFKILMNLFGHTRNCDLAFFVADLSSLESVHVDTGLACNISENVPLHSINGVLGTQLLNSVTDLPQGPETVIAYVTATLGGKSGVGENKGWSKAFQLSEGTNLFMPLKAERGQLGLFKSYLTKSGLVESLRASIPFLEKFDLLTLNYTQCPDVIFDVAYTDNELVMDRKFFGAFDAKNALIRILDGSLPCNPNGSTYALSFDLSLPDNGEVSMDLTASAMFNNSKDFEIGLEYSGLVRNLSFPGYRNFFIADHAVANFSAVAAYQSFEFESFYFTGNGHVPILGLENVAFSARYLKLPQGADMNVEYGVHLLSNINVASLDTLICQISGKCGKLDALQGMQLDSNFRAEVSFANTDLDLFGIQLFAGLQFTISKGMRILPRSVNHVLKFLNWPDFTGAFGLVVPFDRPEEFILWFQMSALPLDTKNSSCTEVIGCSSQQIQTCFREEIIPCPCNDPPKNPQTGVIQMTPKSVFRLESLRIDVIPVTVNVRIEATMAIYLSDKTLYFAGGGGVRRGVEVFIFGRMIGSWRNIAGISGLHLLSAGIEVGITAGPTLSTLGIWGGLRLGDIRMNVTTYFGTIEQDYVFMGSVKNLTMTNFVNFIEDATGTNLPDITADILTNLFKINIHNILIYIAPKSFILYPATPNQIPIAAGMKFRGKFEIFGFDVDMGMGFEQGDTFTISPLTGKPMLLSDSSSAILPTSKTTALLNGIEYTVPDFLFSMSLKDVSLITLLPSWNIAEYVIDKVEDLLNKKSTLSFPKPFHKIKIPLRDIDKALEPVKDALTNLKDNAVKINEFAIEDFSLYKLATGKQGAKIKIHLTVAEFDIKAETRLQTEFFKKSASEMRAWLKTWMQTHLKNIHDNQLVNLNNWATSVLKFFKFRLRKNPLLCGSRHNIFKLVTKCIDFDFWHDSSSD